MNLTKDEIREGLSKMAVEMVAKYDKTLLQWCTGTGKTLAAIRCQESLGSKRTLVLVAEVAHKGNWEDEYRKHGYEHLLESTELVCYASLKTLKGREYDFVIFDEAHHVTTEMRLEFTQLVRFKKSLLLTATFSDKSKRQFIDVFGTFQTHNYPLHKAIEDGVLPKPRVILWELELDKVNRERVLYRSRGSKKKKITVEVEFEGRWKYLKKADYPDIDLYCNMTEQQRYDDINQQIEYMRKKGLRNDILKNLYMSRKRLIGSLKTQYLLQLKRLLYAKRYIMFTSTVEQAKQLSKNAIHSKLKNPLEVLTDFNERRRNHLVAVGMLQEGVNLTNIGVGIIGQLDADERGFVQKFGRVLRSETPICFILYFKDTQDVEYVGNVLDNIEDEYLEVISSLDEIRL